MATLCPTYFLHDAGPHIVGSASCSDSMACSTQYAIVGSLAWCSTKCYIPNCTK